MFFTYLEKVFQLLLKFITCIFFILTTYCGVYKFIEPLDPILATQPQIQT